MVPVLSMKFAVECGASKERREKHEGWNNVN